MLHSLDAAARQTLFIVRDSLARKITFPEGWQTIYVSSEVEFLGIIETIRRSEQRILILVHESELVATEQVLKSRLSGTQSAHYGIFVVSNDPEKLLEEKNATMDLLDVVPEKEFKKAPHFHLKRALRLLLLSEQSSHPRLGQKTLEMLNHIFISLSAERNPEKLLGSIVQKAIELTHAEGGMLYMVSESDGEMFFRLKITAKQNEEVQIQPVNIKVVENSICGYVTLTGKLLNIHDTMALRPLTLPQFSRNIDHGDGDKSCALLTMPLKSSRNDLVGVLQLMNKRVGGAPNSVNAFEVEDESLLSSYATQAAICLENVDLYADIQRLFDGFVKASIAAIESRDPSTGGHSERVAKMSVALARATTECNTGIYRSVKFRDDEVRELEYAALLHDFGKIGVREQILTKAKKLYSYQLESIRDRIKICKAAAKITYLEKRLKTLGQESALEKEFLQRLKEIEWYWEVIQDLNEPSVTRRENIELLEKIRREQLLLPDGSQIDVLTEEEYLALSITQGSLTDSERLEIESHVRHTYQFLKMIPWTRDFKHLTEIAHCHHEKLDGSGYPRGLTSHEIPLQSKIMTISDIYDALTAADRWYKDAVPAEKALDILKLEVNQGKLDPVLFEIFVEKKIYEVTDLRSGIQVA